MRSKNRFKIYGSTFLCNIILFIMQAIFIHQKNSFKHIFYCSFDYVNFVKITIFELLHVIVSFNS